VRRRQDWAGSIDCGVGADFVSDPLERSSNFFRLVWTVLGTAAPESTGNVALAGHRDTFFRGVGRVRLKDLIELETAQGKYEYEVLLVAVVNPNQIEVLESSNQSELTLVTCYPFHYVGAAAQRLVVRSTRVAAH
jgi:sortase A